MYTCLLILQIELDSMHGEKITTTFVFMKNEIYRHVVSGDVKKCTPRINKVWKCFQFNPI